MKVFCSSSAVDGAWEEEAKGDDEENKVDRRMRSNSCSKPWFSNLNKTNMLAHVRNVIKNLFFSPNFLLTLKTYELLFYSVCLHCANLHTLLPFLSYLYDFQTMKTRHSDPFYGISTKGGFYDNYSTSPGCHHTPDQVLHPLPTAEESLLCLGTQLCPDQLTGGLVNHPLPQTALLTKPACNSQRNHQRQFPPST